MQILTLFVVPHGFGIGRLYDMYFVFYRSLMQGLTCGTVAQEVAHFYTLMKIAAHFQTLKKPLISTFSLISAAFSFCSGGERGI